MNQSRRVQAVMSGMRDFQWLLSVVVVVSLLGPNAAWAAAISIGDTSPSETIIVSANDFECGFSVNGARIQQGLGSPGSITVPESAGPVTFHGEWIDLGQAAPGSRTIWLVEYCGPGNKLHKRVSDVLHITVSHGGSCGGVIDGTFISDADPTNNGQGGLGKLPSDVNPDDVFFEDGTPVPFGAAFLSGAVISDTSKQGNCQ
jgi:hypothetical protein